LASASSVTARNVAFVGATAIVVVAPAGTVDGVLVDPPTGVVVPVELFDELLHPARTTTAPRSAAAMTCPAFMLVSSLDATDLGH